MNIKFNKIKFGIFIELRCLALLGVKGLMFAVKDKKIKIADSLLCVWTNE